MKSLKNFILENKITLRFYAFYVNVWHVDDYFDPETGEPVEGVCVNVDDKYRRYFGETLDSLLQGKTKAKEYAVTIEVNDKYIIWYGPDNIYISESQETADYVLQHINEKELVSASQEWAKIRIK